MSTFSPLFIPAFFLMILVSSCKKEDNLSAKAKSLTSREWIRVKVEVRTNNDPWVEVSNQPVCETDNRLIFRSDNSYERNEGATKCNPSDPQIIESSVWSFAENETKLLFGTANGVIEQLDANTMIIISNPTGVPTYNSRITYSH